MNETGCSIGAALRMLREGRIDELGQALDKDPGLFALRHKRGLSIASAVLLYQPENDSALRCVLSRLPLSEACVCHGGLTLAGIASDSGNVPALALLAERGADLRALDEQGHAPVHIAAQNGRAETLEFLASHGAADVPDAHGYNAFHWLTLCHEPFAAARALAGHLRPDTPGPLGRTALHQAAINSAASAAKALLLAGANPDARDRDGATPLALATAKANNEIMDVLLEHGADIDLADHEGRAPIDLAIDDHYETNVLFIAGHGARLDRRARDGTTPLMRAAGRGMSASALFMLEKGADPFAADIAGKNAFDHARASGNEALLLAMLQIAEKRALDAAADPAGQNGKRPRI